MTKQSNTHPDGDIHKGAVEQDAPAANSARRPGHGSMTGQLGHRDHDAMLKDNDTDYPEPDAEAEHSSGR